MSEEERLKKAQNQQRNVVNNTNNIRKVANIASKTDNPYAKAAGTAVKVADKLSGGKSSELLGKALNTANKFSHGGRMLQKVSNKMAEGGTSNRIANALSKKKGISSTTRSNSVTAGANMQSNAISEGKENNLMSRKEVEEQTSDGGDVNLKATVNFLKVSMIAFVPIMIVLIFMNLIVAGSQTYLRVIGLGKADKVSSDAADTAIRENGSKGLDEEITDENVNDGLTGYIYERNINNTSKIVFIAKIKDREYNEADLNQLEDFYSDINSYKNGNYNMNIVYKFFFKLMYIQRHYSKNYDVELDMPLLMSVLSIQSTEMSEVFVSNTDDYKIYSSDNPEDNPEDNPNFKYTKDWTNYTSTRTQSSHDIELLAQNMVTRAKDSGCSNTIDGACYKIVEKDKYKEFLKEFLEKKYYTDDGYTSNKSSEPGFGGVSGSGTLTVEESYSNGTSKMEPGVVLSSEPDPSVAINYWSYLDPNEFVYPKDKQTGKSLGAWPKNYKNIPTQLENVKVYQGGYIWPLTPTNGIYTFVYEHNGMDIMATFGAPIYSPVDGTLLYSTWGYTSNKGSDETAYSVTITPDIKLNYNGVVIDSIFFTHMSGIIYRCEWGQCNIKVKKGELIGFVGNAAGNATSVGWAPHLHLSYYNSSNYNGGLKTSVIENLYSIKSNTKRKAGE